MAESCHTCKHYREPNCRRYPHSMAAQPGWWCGEYKKKPVTKKPTQFNLDTKELITTYCEKFEKFTGEKPIVQGVDVQAAKTIISELGLKKGRSWIDRFYSEEMPMWNRDNRAMSLRNIPSAINKMAAYDD